MCLTERAPAWTLANASGAFVAWMGFEVALCLLGSDLMAAEVNGNLTKDNYTHNR